MLLRRILMHDLRLLVADRSLIVFTLMFALLMAYAAIGGAAWRQKRVQSIEAWQADLQAAIETDRRQVLSIETGKVKLEDAPYAGMPSWLQLPAVLPPHALSSLSIGQAELYPFTSSINAYSTKTALFANYEIDNPTTLLAGRFDMAFVLIYLYPLLILALSYNLLTHESETGTLQMTLAQAPLRLRDVAFGKAAARYSFACTLAVVLTLAGLAVGDVSLMAEGLFVRVLWLVLLIAAYTLFWFAVSLAVNARGKSSAANAALLIGLWLALVIVVPSLLSITATSLYPVPSRFNFIRDSRRNDNEINRMSEKLLANYYGDHPELAPEGKLDLTDFSTRYYALKQEAERRAKPLVDAYDTQLARQQKLVDATRFLSPAVVMQEALNAIAGTDRARFLSYRDQVWDYVEGWQSYVAPRLFRRLKLSSADYVTLPHFAFREEAHGEGEVASRALSGFCGLLVPAIIASFIAMRWLRCFPLTG